LSIGRWAAFDRIDALLNVAAAVLLQHRKRLLAFLDDGAEGDHDFGHGRP
jgi:hypothetical protein